MSRTYSIVRSILLKAASLGALIHLKSFRIEFATSGLDSFYYKNIRVRVLKRQHLL